MALRLGKRFGLGGIVLGVALLGVAAVPAARADIGISISVGTPPPVLPVYAQPVCPGDGYLWTPGYWAYGPGGYFWVPGAWVLPPQPGYLWTPAYWGFEGGQYRFFHGYWGPRIGFYGGVNYGFGYFGHGYEGGYWDRDRFLVNRTVNNINVTNVHNTYVRNVTVVNNVNRVSYNGGNGIQARPEAAELAAARDRHFDATPNQVARREAAAGDRGQFAQANGGRPQRLAEAGGGGREGGINDRAGDQQNRINRGVQQGQLTPGEAQRLQNRQNSIQSQVQADRAANGGRLTPDQRQAVQQRLDNRSQAIRNDRTNANTDAAWQARQGQPMQARQQAEMQRQAQQGQARQQMQAERQNQVQMRQGQQQQRQGMQVGRQAERPQGGGGRQGGGPPHR